MANIDKSKILERIRSHIEEYGFHLYIVTGGSVPRFAYTVGLIESIGAELVFAGGESYFAADVERIVGAVRSHLAARGPLLTAVPVEGLGTFTLQTVHSSWARSLLLGALDYYKRSDVTAYQIVPDRDHVTIDVPNMACEWSVAAEPIWQWLHETWNYDVPSASTATTNLEALRGARITEVMRWGEDEWEMFAGPGPDVAVEEARVIPLGCLLAADPSLVTAVDLQVGKGLWRDHERGDWNPWSAKSDADVGNLES